MNENIIDGKHSVYGNIVLDGHAYSDNVKTGLHTQIWFGDRFISGIQDEDLNFIVDKTGKIIFEE